MKIVRLTAENFQRLVAVEIKPDGNTVLITGRNGAGKSSVLDAIMAVLCGKKYSPQKPIRNGADHAEVVIETENWTIKRTFTESGGGSVTVTNADGMRGQSPQSLLNKIVGQIAFDPMIFIDMGRTETGKKQQRTVLMKLVGLDFSDIDEKIAGVKAERTQVRAVKETYEHDAAQIAVGDDAPNEEVSLSDLIGKMNTAKDHNTSQATKLDEVDRLYDDSQKYGETIKTQDEWIEQMEEKLNKAKKLREDNAKLRAKVCREEAELRGKIQDSILLEPIQAEIDVVEQTNTAVRAKKDKKEKLAKVAEMTAQYSDLGKAMKILEASKAKRLSEAKMPLEGLSVTDDGVVFEGIPLSQVNDAKKLEIGMGIAMAENPELRVIKMKGNDLDEDSLKVVAKMAKDKDFQVWIERIEGEGGIIIEDGSVKK